MKLSALIAFLTSITYLFIFVIVSFEFNIGAKYPNKPITIVVHSKPGSGVDLMARKVAAVARKYSKVAFVVENRTGTQGMIAMKYVIDKKADGYTLLAVTKSFLSTVIVNKSRVRMSDFHFVGNMISDAEALITNKTHEINTFQDLLKDAKEKDGEQVWIGPGTGGRDHIMAIKTWDVLGIKAKWLDYKSGPQSVLAMLRKEAPVYVGNPLDIKGKEDLAIAAIAAPERLEAFPDTPTFKELGFDLEEYMWRGFAFKKGTPANAIKYIEDVLRRVSVDEEWLSYCKGIYAIPKFIGNFEFTKMVALESKETIGVLKKARLLEEYEREGFAPLWLVALVLLIVIYLFIFALCRFDLKRINREIVLAGLLIWISSFFYLSMCLV